MTLGEIAKETFDANSGRPNEVWDIVARAVSDEVLRRNGNGIEVPRRNDPELHELYDVWYRKDS